MTTYTQTRSVEWLLAALMLAWGLGLMIPGNTMDLAAYQYLGALAPEPVWAAWSISIATTRLMALYVNGAWFRTPLIRAVCSALGLIWWLVLGFLLQAGVAASYSAMPAALLWYPVFAGFEGYSVYRGARDSYYTGALRRWRPSPR